MLAISEQIVALNKDYTQWKASTRQPNSTVEEHEQLRSVVEQLMSDGGVWSIRQLTEALDRNRASVRRAVYALETLKRVFRCGEHKPRPNVTEFLYRKTGGVS